MPICHSYSECSVCGCTYEKYSDAENCELECKGIKPKLIELISMIEELKNMGVNIRLEKGIGLKSIVTHVGSLNAHDIKHEFLSIPIETRCTGIINNL